MLWGGAYGYELNPIWKRIKSITILDPSDIFVSSNKDINYRKPNLSGLIDDGDCSYNAIICLGVLHHIPNVQFILMEMYRVLKKGGRVFLREPIVSMGDWRLPRSGLTRRERGIPLALLLEFANLAGFSVERKRLVMFSPLATLLKELGYAQSIYNNRVMTKIDWLLSSIFSFNAKTYHRKHFHEKFSPSAVYLVLKK